MPAFDGERHAVALGQWLLSIQDAEGWWHGGLHPPKERAASVFNTAQVLHGLVALHERTGEDRWLQGGAAASRWLAAGMGADGLWSGTDYRQRGTPSYYTFALWPMLAMAERTGEEEIRRAAIRGLDAILERRREDGSFARWGFEADAPAFTHTIAYTLQGLLESAHLVGDWSAYGQPAEAALGELQRRTGLSAGRLPGRFDERWSPAASYVCLTGNAQVAICLLHWDRRQPDQGLVDSAARLLDYVCGAQHLRGPAGFRGAVRGSSPIWGRYMALRYPNWAAKFHCDALLGLMGRMRQQAKVARVKVTSGAWVLPAGDASEALVAFV